MTSPRDRLLAVASDLVRRHGVAGTGLSALLAESRTARGSIYQHFPGGKDELVVAATDAAGQVMRTETWTAPAGAGPGDLVREVVGRARATLDAEDYTRGCPVVAAAVSGPDHPAIVDAAARAFSTWTGDLAAALRDTGIEAEAAQSFASVLISAVEGAIVQARAQRDPAPLDAVAEHLGPLAETLVRVRPR